MADVRNGDNRQDQTPPNVQSVFPTGGQTDLSKNTTVTATFSEAMDASTIADASGASNTFTLTEQGATTPVGATVGYDAATKKATLDPSADLKANTIYTATVKGGTSGIKDLADIPLAADKSWSFATAAPIPETTGPRLNFNLAIIFVALAVFAYVVTIVVLLAFTKLEAAAVTTVLGTLLAFMG